MSRHLINHDHLCPGCGELHIIVIDAAPILKDLSTIKTELRKLVRHMSALDDRLADLQAAEDTNTAKLATLLADFENAGTLTDAQTAALDALKNEIVGNSASIDAADPNAATPPTV